MFNHHLMQFAGYKVRPFDLEQGISHPNEIYRISIDYDESNWDRKFSEFVDDPLASQAKGIVVGAWMGNEFDKSAAIAINALINSVEKLPNLHAIFLGDILSEENEVSWIIQSNVSPLLAAYPALTHLGIRGGEQLQFSPIEHANLTTLIVETGGLNHQVVDGILASKFPNLTHLELYIGTDEYGRTTEVEHLASLLSQALFPSLRYLGLRDANNANDIALAIANAPILDQIKILDLSLGTLTDIGGKSLLTSNKVSQSTKARLALSLPI